MQNTSNRRLEQNDARFNKSLNLMFSIFGCRQHNFMMFCFRRRLIELFRARPNQLHSESETKDSTHTVCSFSYEDCIVPNYNIFAFERGQFIWPLAWIMSGMQQQLP